jgi:lysophospholipase L1-like esterase
MKKLKYLLFLAAVALNVQTASAQKHDFAWWYRFEGNNKEIGLPAKGEKRVILFGNSITEYWPYKRGEWFKENNIIGRGIGGQTTYQFMLRFYDDVINLKPKVVVINGAINDIAENTGPYNEDHTFENICSMVEMARQNKITVVLASVLPAHAFNWHPGIEDPMGKVRRLNARIKAYAEANKIIYVDYFSAMVSADGTRMQEDLADDGVHPTEKGYKIMEAMILPIINKLRK